MDKDARLLSKVEPDRREFLKRLALAAAYTTPVVSSFSFDSLIPGAAAQGTYTVPTRVVDVVFVPGAGANGLIVSRLAQTVDPWGTIRITYSKPMQTSLNSCKKVTGYEGECLVDSKIDVVAMSVSGVDECTVDLSSGWAWPDDATEERDIYTQVSRIDLQLNAPELGCSGEASYRAQDGNLMEPYVGALDTSEYCDIILSKVDFQAL